MKTLKQKFEDWMTLAAYAESDEPEMGFCITGHRAHWMKRVVKGKANTLHSAQAADKAKNAEARTPLEPHPLIEGAKHSKQKLEVMLVDDEPIVGKRLAPALKKYGYDVEVFQNPVKAIDRFHEKEFDVVVTDMRMDKLNGIQVLEQVMAMSSRTKVIFITGYATVENAREALIKGAFDFIAKPFKPNDLRMAIVKAAMSLGFRGEFAGVAP